MELTFKVRDPFLEWNNRSFVVRIAVGGEITATPGESVQPIELDIGTLTTLLMSYKSPSYLYKLGRMKTTAATLELLERVIPKEKAYISDYI